MSQYRECYLCHKSNRDTELRSYGFESQFICYQCMISTGEHQREAEKQFAEQFSGVHSQAVVVGQEEGPLPFGQHRNH